MIEKELKDYVEKLFAPYKKDPSSFDIKEEILSNLEAKYQDLIKEGLSRDAAIECAKQGIPSIDELIDGNSKICINQFKLENLQLILLFITIGWILSMPILILEGSYSLNSISNAILFILVIVIGLVYVVKKHQYQNESRYYALINFTKYKKQAKLIWFLWTLYFIVHVLIITGITFGSNIWFGRPILLNGPYQFAMHALQYYKPLLTILIPIYFMRRYRLLLHQEEREIQ